jgi:hypothetical protein
MIQTLVQGLISKTMRITEPRAPPHAPAASPKRTPDRIDEFQKAHYCTLQIISILELTTERALVDEDVHDD